MGDSEANVQHLLKEQIAGLITKIFEATLKMIESERSDDGGAEAKKFSRAEKCSHLAVLYAFSHTMVILTQDEALTIYAIDDLLQLLESFFCSDFYKGGALVIDHASGRDVDSTESEDSQSQYSELTQNITEDLLSVLKATYTSVDTYKISVSST
jgi:hypothetical protein